MTTTNSFSFHTRALVAGSLIFALSSCQNDAVTEPTQSPLAFHRLTLDDQANGPAFADVGDINQDGKLDLVVSKFGKVSGLTLPYGEVTAYLQGESLRQWTAVTIVSPEDKLIWPNEIKLFDIDNDLDLDLFVPLGFLICPFVGDQEPCGGLIWYEQNDGQWIRHDIIEPGSELFYHSVVFADLDEDGIQDLITVGEEQALASTGEGKDRAQTVWFKGNNSAERFELQPKFIGHGLGSIPNVRDIDQDGDLDIASAEYFAKQGASFTWFEQTSVAWVRRVIDDTVGPSIQLSFIDNFNKSTPTVAIGSNHSNTSKESPDPWESGIYLYKIPTDPRLPWPKQKISENIVSIRGNPSSPQAAPGIFGWGDIDDDGDQDLLVSGDGDPRVFLMEQTESSAFKMHVLEENLTQAGAMKVVDLNSDGKKELVVSGYDDSVIYIYEQGVGGKYPLGLAEKPERNTNKQEDLIIEVTYEGPKAGNLVAALFENYPPQGPPVEYVSIDNVTFPAQVNFGAKINPGNYHALIYLDAAPFDVMQNGPEDPYVVAPVDMPLLGSMKVSLSESGGSSMNSPPNTMQIGTVEVTLNYSGNETGDILVAAFSSLPPTGPPIAFELSSTENFPVTISVPNVPEGTVQILAFLDLAPFNIMSPGPEDPQASSQPLSISGQTKSLTLALNK